MPLSKASTLGVANPGKEIPILVCMSSLPNMCPLGVANSEKENPILVRRIPILRRRYEFCAVKFTSVPPQAGCIANAGAIHAFPHIAQNLDGRRF